MNDQDVRTLLSWGYKVNGSSITDANGNYVPSVTKYGITINSVTSAETFSALQKTREKAKAQETPDPIKALAKFEKDPLKTPMTKDMKESYPYYKQMQEKVDKAGYFTPEDFEKYEEERATKEAEESGFASQVGVLRNLQQSGHKNTITDELINSIKQNASDIKNMEDRSPSVYSYTKNRKKELEEEWEKEVSWKSPSTYLKAASNILEGRAVDFSSSIVKFFGESTGMNASDEKKKEYENLLKKEKELKAPAATIIRDQIKVKKEKLEDLYSRKSFGEKFGREADMLRYAINEVEEQETNLEDFVNGSKVYNPLNHKFIGGVATLGVQGVIDGFLHYKPLMEKINAGEELTEAEQAVAEAFATSYQADGIKIEQDWRHNLTKGTAESAAFMASMVGPGAIMKGASKAISTKVAKGFMEMGFSRTAANIGGKVVGETVSTFGKVALNPTTYTNALEHYYGPIRFEDNEDGELKVITTDRRDHKLLTEKADLEIENLKDKISKEQDPEKVKELNYQLSKVEDGKSRIAPLPTVGDAIGYGFTEVLKEVAVEQYGGALANKLVNNRLTRGAIASPWAQSIRSSAVGKAFSKANNMFGDAKTAFNGLVGETGEKLIGNNLEEMAEEIAVQILPVWGETEEEAIQRKGELLSASFYGQVAGQTLLMGGVMQGVYAPMQTYNNYRTRQGQKEERDAFKDMMNSFKEGNLSEDKVTELLMGAGHSGFSIQEYNNKIAKARQEGRHDVANDLERNRTYNSGKALVKIGQGKEFVRTMEGLIATGKIPAESIANVQEAVNEVKTLERETKEYEGLRNRDYILELKSKERYTNNQKSKLEKKQAELLEQKESPERDGELEGIKEALKENEILSNRLSKAVKHETSPKMVKKLQLEADMAKDLYKSYNKSKNDTLVQDKVDEQNKRLTELEQVRADILQEEDSSDKTQRLANINEVIEKFTAFSKEAQDKNKTKTRKEFREDAIKELKNKYGKTVTPADYKRAQKQFDRAILSEILDEQLEKTMNQTEEEFDKEQETDVEVSKSKQHVVDLANSIDEVTAMINNTPGKSGLELETQNKADQQSIENNTQSETLNSETEQERISKITDPELRKTEEIKYIMSKLFSGVGEASATKIKQYADRIINGTETRDSVVQGLPKSFVEGIDALVNATQQSTVTTNNTQVAIKDKKDEIERLRKERKDLEGTRTEINVGDTFIYTFGLARDGLATVVRDNKDGTIRIKYSDGTIKNERKSNVISYLNEQNGVYNEINTPDNSFKVTELNSKINTLEKELKVLEKESFDTLNNMSDPEIKDDGYSNLADPEITPIDDSLPPEITDQNLFDYMPDLPPLPSKNDKGAYENEAVEKLVRDVEKRVAEMKEESGAEITFQDYIDDLLDKGEVPRENIEAHFRALALGWSGANLGPSNWKSVYKDLFKGVQAAVNHIENKNNTPSPAIEEATKVLETEEQEILNKNSTSKPLSFDPKTEGPVHITPNTSKTYGTELTLHYSAVEFEHEVQEIDGKKVYVKVQQAVPKLRETNNDYSFKDLVNPNKNNIGSTLKPVLLQGDQLADYRIAVRDKYGRQTSTISFEEWVDKNKPDGMKLEAFQETDLYIGQVPIVYHDSQGKSVAPVTEVDWYTPTSVGDRSKTVDEIDLDNLTESHKQDIEENRKQALEIRKAILNGTLIEMEIADNLGHFPLQIIGKTDSNGDPVPTKSLNEVSPDSQIVWMASTGALYDLDKKVINTADILNMGDDTEGFLKTETIIEYDNDGNVKSKQKLPIFRNRTHYLSHVATVDGVKKYMILNTQRKNEDQGNSANREDVETARWIAAVNNITMFANTPSGSEIAKDLGHPLNMSPEQAEDIRRQVKEITGVDIKHEYSTLIEGLVAYQTPSKPGEKMGEKVTFASKMVGKLKAYNKSTGEFTSPSEDYVQNTYMSKGGFSLKDKPMISIKKVDGKFVVEKVKTAPKMVNRQESTTADTYEQFLKERLSTNVMGYNVGTEKEPVYTIAVQQKIKLKPVYKTESTEETLDKNIEAKKKDPEVKAKVEEVEDKSVKTKVLDSLKRDLEEEKNSEFGNQERIDQLQNEINILEGKPKDLTVSEKEARKIAVENATALAAELNLDIRDIDLSDDMVVAEMTSTENVDKSIASIEKVSVKQEEEVISWLFSKLAAKDADIKEVKQSLETELKTRVGKIDKAIADLKEFDDNTVVQNLMGTLLAAKEQAESTLNATDKLLAEASLRAVNTAFITDEYVEDETVENVKDFSKSDSQTKPIDKVGTALKRVFAQIPNGKTGFLGLTSFASFKQMYDTVSLALSNDINLTPNFKEMMDLLSKREESAPWMKPLIDTLMESDEQVKNQFVYNAYKQKVNAKFATLSFDKNKNVISNIYDSNSNESKRAVVELWKENFKRSPLNDEGKISKDGLKAAIDQWNSWFESGTDKQTDAEYQNWLDKFGIKLSPNTWAALRRGELNTSQDGGRLQPSTFSELFKDLTVGANKKRSGYLFSNLMRFATINIDKEGSDLEFYNNTKNHPFDDMGTILNQLSELESRYNPVYSSTSRYVNGKSVSEIESMSYFYEQINKLKKSAFSEDKTYLNDLQGLSFSKDSFILQLLREDPVFADQFNHGLVDLMSLKELYKKSPMFAGIDELSELDYMFTQRAMFQNRNQGKERFVGSSPFKIRMASMSTLTNSDKGRMMLLKTAVFDFYKQSEQAFEITDQGEVKFTEDLNNLLYDSLIMPELRRMVNFSIRHKDVDPKDNKTNIKAYDKGAVRFNLIPGLNVLKGTDGKNIIEFIEEITNKEKSEKAVLDAVKLNFGEAFSNSIQDNVIKEAEGNVKSLSQFEVSKDVDSFNNVDYLSQRPGEVSENMKIAELDYTLNSMLTNMNYMQLMAGDPALYYKSKLDEKSNDVADQNKISQELAINLGKRMAAMIAPGSVLADSHDNTYVQVFLDDVNGTADNILDIVEWHYGEKVLNEKNSSGTTYKELLENLKNGDRKNLKELQNKFKNVAEFLDIESTDAQEYTTLKEHLYVMEKQGRISEKEMKAIQSNLAKGKDLTKEQLKLVLQPIKPVYTGTILDTEQDVNRMMYIKSSSFPLIPQLTKGRKLDDLRKNMEQLEKDLETTVRASYQTANKVGALTNAVKDFSAPIKLEQTLKMNREHFKIQQDVPFKSDKVQDDTVSMGTQIFKLLMGDGIMEMDGFKFDGKEFTGKELQEEFHNIFSQMVGLKKDKFLNSLGLDKDMNAVDSEATLYKFEKLLIREAKSRGFSKQDLNSLKLIRDPKTNELTFKMPLWMSGNSDKYESMMNALINNKIFAQKIPGNKFVTGSEAGFEIKDTMKGVDKSRIVHLGNFKGDVLQSTRTKEGGLTKAQVLAPSKFKINGTLIDLFEDFNGTDGTYLELFEGNIRIKPGMIDPKLLEQFVFRIPTSSHGLGTSVEIVGFLPPESGDLIITPKGFVAQMGQDFDIDSLTAYQYNHIVMEDGSIKELTEENKEAYLKETEAKIDYLSDLIKDNKYEIYNRLLESVPGVDLGQLSQKEMLEELATAKENLNKDYDLKLLENKFIGVHNAVYSNPQAQKNINKVLSMSFAEQQADDIESLTLTSDNSFNILSPKHQMQKMNAGSTGQDAIGVYAKGVTLHSLAQQAQALGKDIRLGSQTTKERKLKKVQLGNLQSDGRLGMTETIKSKDTSFKSLSRRISTVLDERTNTGTDNEKAQILGRTGLNHMDAIAVDNLLSLLGFDAEYTKIYSQEEFDNLSYEKKQDAIVYEEGKPFHRKQEIDGKTVHYLEHSIPYLLHSQPIIREYFASINEKKSITTSFSGKAEEVVLQELIAKYADKSEVGEPAIMDGEFVRLVTSGRETIPVRSQDNGVFTGQLLQNQITLGEKSDNKIQLQILATYVDLISQAKNVKTMMQHVDLNNLGKSMWESTTKADEFRKFFSELDKTGLIGAEHLIGSIHFQKSEGKDYIDLGNNTYLKPTTNQGVMVGTALSLSESLFTDFFPAKSDYLNNIIEGILESTEVNVNNSFAYIKAKEQIFQEVKKYLTSNDKLGIFNKPSGEVRKTLFIDDKVNGNVSLSSYVNNLMSNSSSEFAPGMDKVQNNLFLNLLKTPMGENGKPSLITFNNQESFEANQEAIYSSFKELISEDLSLPRIQRNGESEAYSTRQLAQDLIAYSYASGGIVQGALEFHKFLPMEYLDDMTQVTSSGNTMSITDRMRRFNILNNDSAKHSILSNFEKQYFQNNPEAAIQSEMQTSTMPNGSQVFFPKEFAAGRSKFISKKLKTDSKLKQDKWALYEKVEGEDYYRQVAVLGENGMSEYEFGTKNLNSNLGTDKFKESTQIRNASFIEHKDLGKIPENNSSMVSFLEGIVSGEYDMPADKKAIAEYLIKFVDPKATFKYEEGDFKGRSTPGEVMRLNLNKMKSRQDLATTFMHEAIHEITSGFINTYIDGDNKLIEGAPSELQSLNILFENYKSELYKKDPDKYVAFQEKWKQRQIARAAGNADVITYTKQEVEDFGAYYPIVNLKEFVAVALSNNEKFISTAGKMKYLETGGSVAKKFGELMTRILKRIGMANNIEENTVALQAIGRSLSLIDKIGTIKNEVKTVENNPSVTPDDMVSIKAKILELNTQNNKREILPIKTTKNTCK